MKPVAAPNEHPAKKQKRPALVNALRVSRRAADAKALQRVALQSLCRMATSEMDGVHVAIVYIAGIPHVAAFDRVIGRAAFRDETELEVRAAAALCQAESTTGAALVTLVNGGGLDAALAAVMPARLARCH